MYDCPVPAKIAWAGLGGWDGLCSAGGPQDCAEGDAPARAPGHAPVRTVKYAVTPRPVRQVSRAVYTITNPLGAAENKLIGAALNAGSGHRHPATPVRSFSMPAERSVSGTGVRAAEAVASRDRLATLMAVQRERFTQAQRPVIPDPEPVHPAPFERQEWARRKSEAHFWQRAKRNQLCADIREHAQRHAAALLAHARAEQEKQQAEADAWWDALNMGEPGVLAATLGAAFADNPAPVAVIKVDGPAAALAVLLPGPDVLPEKKPHVTPSGRLSSKAWPKTELNEVYAQLLGAHLLATMREAWAVAPSLTNVRLIGIRASAGVSFDVLFDVDLDRAGGLWDDDRWGDTILGKAQWGLNRTGRAQEIHPWPPQKLRPDVLGLLT